MLVIPTYRNLGVGKDLLLYYEQYLLDNDIRDVHCLPWSYLEHFYSKVGFLKAPIENAPKFLQARYEKYQQEYQGQIIYMQRVL